MASADDEGRPGRVQEEEDDQHDQENAFQQARVDVVAARPPRTSTDPSR